MVVCAKLMHIPHEGWRLANRDKIKGKGIVKYGGGGDTSNAGQSFCTWIDEV